MRRDKRFFRRPDPGASLYAISAGREFIKFGYAARPKYRTTNLQVGSPFELTLLASIKMPDQACAQELERLIHRSVARYHVRGEWFQSCPKTLAIVEFMKLDLPQFERLMHKWAGCEEHYARKECESRVHGSLHKII